MVQESQTKWKAESPADLSPQAQWQNFKVFCCKKPEEYGCEGIATKKAASEQHARSIISQETINQQTNDHLEGIQDQLDSLTHTMGMMSQQT